MQESARLQIPASQNLKKIADLPVDKLLLRLPQISLAHDIVAYADISLNSEEHTLQALSAAP